MVQGNWVTEAGTNYNMLLDHRKSPILTMINSLSDGQFSAAGATNLRKALSLGLTESAIRDTAYKQALDTNMVLLGVTTQFTPRWQLGGDIQWSRVSGQAGASAGAIALAEKVALDNLSLIHI